MNCCNIISKRHCQTNKDLPGEQVGQKDYEKQISCTDSDGYTEIPSDLAENENGYSSIVIASVKNTIPLKDLQFGHTIGEGAFGKVVIAKAMNLTYTGIVTQVAVKMLKTKHTDAQAKNLRREFEIMNSVGYHKNIINLLGCSFDAKKNVLIVMDYAFYGSLSNYLKTQEKISQGDLAMFGWQVACGMEHLASKQCVHRDLAARNVLVTEDLTLKVSDFGLAQSVQEEGFYANNSERCLVSYKWMAPECLTYQVFGPKSDIWSFGVLLWELYSRADDPYPNVNFANLKQMLENGQRLAKPKHCPKHMYKLMSKCWNYVAACRPTFEDIVVILKESTKSQK